MIWSYHIVGKKYTKTLIKVSHIRVVIFLQIDLQFFGMYIFVILSTHEKVTDILTSPSFCDLIVWERSNYVL